MNCGHPYQPKQVPTCTPSGLLIVHPKEKTQRAGDRPNGREFLVNLMDWRHVDAATLQALNPYDLDNPGTGEPYNTVKNR